MRRRLAVASEGGDGTEARSRIPEENEDENTQVATLDGLKHLAESRGTPNQTLDELREVATALEAEERSNENSATSSSAGRRGHTVPRRTPTSMSTQPSRTRSSSRLDARLPRSSRWSDWSYWSG